MCRNFRKGKRHIIFQNFPKCYFLSLQRTWIEMVSLIYKWYVLATLQRCGIVFVEVLWLSVCGCKFFVHPTTQPITMLLPVHLWIMVFR